uniref:Dehydrogenase/reductase SDR family member 11 n=1 Tax=Steinernema glaseri TaxID=37863 RepID=A0A1I7ZZ59_9BILA
MDPSVFDVINNVGLKNHYICAVYAARLMVPRKKGFIVTLSSQGGITHLFGVAYGVGKSACDRMAADMAHELLDANICSISLMPGAVKTELIMSAPLDEDVKKYFINGESIEFSGKCVVALATDSKLMQKTGCILNTTELAREYNLRDLDGRRPYSDVYAHRRRQCINKCRISCVALYRENVYIKTETYGFHQFTTKIRMSGLYPQG